MAQFIVDAKNFVAEKVVRMIKPEAELTDVDLKKAGRESVEYDAKVSVNNPYSHSVTIREVSYKFKSAGRVIASGTIEVPGSLKPNGMTVLKVPLKAYGVLVKLARDVRKDWGIDCELELCLTIAVPIIGNVKIPLSKKAEIKLPTLSDIF